MTLNFLSIEWFSRAPLLVTPFFGVIGRGRGWVRKGRHPYQGSKLKFFKSYFFGKLFSHTLSRGDFWTVTFDMVLSRKLSGAKLDAQVDSFSERDTGTKLSRLDLSLVFEKLSIRDLIVAFPSFS